MSRRTLLERLLHWHKRKHTEISPVAPLALVHAQCRSLPADSLAADSMPTTSFRAYLAILGLFTENLFLIPRRFWPFTCKNVTVSKESEKRAFQSNESQMENERELAGRSVVESPRNRL